MTRQDLKELYQLKGYIKEQTEEYIKKFSLVTKMTQSLDGMPKAHNKSNYAIEEFIDSSTALIEIMNQDLAKEKAIMEQIDKLNNYLYKRILYKRYVLRESFDEISEAIKYDYYNTCKFHGLALNEFDKLDN